MLLAAAKASLVTGPTGPFGPTGATGATGSPGEDVSVWLVGAFTILGALIAGLIGLGTAWYVERKKSELEEQRTEQSRLAAARLVCADLFASRRNLVASFETEKWNFTGEPHNSAWKQNGVVIASMLSPSEFDKVFQAFVQIVDLWQHSSRFYDQPYEDDKGSPDTGRRVVAKAHDQVQEAIGVLHPIAYPDSYHKDGTAKTEAELNGEDTADADAQPLGTKTELVPKRTANDGKSEDSGPVEADDVPLPPPD